MSILLENKRTYSIHFKSMMDFEEHQPEGPNRERFHDYKNNGPSGASSDIYRVLGSSINKPSDIRDGAMLGDAHFYHNKVKPMAQQLLGIEGRDYDQMIQRVQRVPKYTNFGDELDIHKVYKGDLEKAWRTTERIEVDRVHRLVTIIMDVGENWNVDADDTLWNAVVCTKLVDDLQKAGKSVKLIVGGAVRDLFEGSKSKLITTNTITVKEYNQPLAIERVAGMSHLGFYRLFGFASMCAAEYKATDWLGSKYHMNYTNAMPIQIQEEIDAGHTRAIVVKTSKSKAEAERNIAEAYKKLKKYSIS